MNVKNPKTGKKEFKRLEATREVFITDDEAAWNNNQRFNSGFEYEKIETKTPAKKKSVKTKETEDLI